MQRVSHKLYAVDLLSQEWYIMYRETVNILFDYVKIRKRCEIMTTNEKALQMHEQWKGKIETVAKAKVNSREDLAIAYTPGVAEPCRVIAEDRDAVYKYTMKYNRSRF